MSMTWTADLMDNVGDVKLQYMVKHECDGCLPLWTGSAGGICTIYLSQVYTCGSRLFRFIIAPSENYGADASHIFFCIPGWQSHWLFQAKERWQCRNRWKILPRKNMATRYVTMCCEMVPVLCACVVYVSSCQYSDTFIMRLKTRS